MPNWAWLGEEVTANTRFGTASQVRAHVDRLFPGLAGGKEDVERRVPQPLNACCSTGSVNACGFRLGFRPLLISSNRGGNERLQESIVSTSGTWEQDDTFYLMTDALACWFLHSVETGGQPWKELRDLRTQDERLPFEEWIRELRVSGALRNDDVTLLRIEPIP